MSILMIMVMAMVINQSIYQSINGDGDEDDNDFETAV